MNLFSSLLSEVFQRSGSALWEKIERELQFPLRRAINSTKDNFKSRPAVRNGLDRWFKEGPINYYAKRVFRGEDVEDEALAKSFLDYAEFGPLRDAEKMELSEKVVRVFVRNLRDVALQGDDGLVFLGKRLEQRTDEIHHRLDQIVDLLQTQSPDYGVSDASSGHEGSHLLEQEELADLLTELPALLQKLRTSGYVGEDRDSDSPPLPLSSEDREALGLVAASPLSLRLEWLEDLFPNHDWDAAIDSLTQRGFVKWDESHLDVPAVVANRVLSSKEERSRLDETWIDALEPHQYHPDVAVFLALKHLQRGEVGAAVRSLVDVAYLVEPGSENDLLCSALEPILTHQSPAEIDELSDHDAVRAYNALGLCLARNGRHDEALSWFEKLRDYSRSVNDTWGIGQSYINSGVAHYYLGNSDESETCYEKAADHAREHGNDDLLGRALNNLASLATDRDPDRALQLLAESEELKESGGDEAGLLGTTLNRGILAAETGRLELAEDCFRDVVERADRLDRRYLKSLALHNLGNALAENGRHDEALSYYSEAQDLAEKQELQRPLRLALKGKAVTLTQAGAHADAIPFFERLRDAETDADNVPAAIIALHDLGVCLTRVGRTDEARQRFRQSLRKAREEGLSEWIYQGRFALATVHRQSDPDSVVSGLEEAAEDEMKRENYDVAGRLWIAASEEVLRRQEDSQPESKDAEAVTRPLRKAVETFRKGDHTEGFVEAYGRMYVFYRRLGSHRDALKTLDEALETIPRQHPEAASFEDERGTRFQHLGRYKEAEEAHRRSLEMSREAGDDVGVEASLNNLGELYRRTERPEQALTFYREAEELARGRGDEQERLSVAHNRALALSDLGRLDEAKDLMEEIKAQAEATGSTRELARALHGEAILAWQETPSRETLSLFQEAMQRAQELGEYGQAVDAAANYGSLLLNFDEAGTAVRTLQPLEGKVYQTDLPRQYEYFATLGDAYERLGDFPNARSCWSTAHRIGREMGTPDPILTSLVSLAGIDLRTGYAEEADQKVERALEHAPNAPDEAGVLLGYLDRILTEDGQPRIEAVQEQIHDLVAQHDLDEAYIDMHMKIGDYYLNKDRRRHLEGCQHYVAGLARATDLLISDDKLNPMSRIGVHVVIKITSLDAEDRAEHLSRLLQQLESWLNDEVEHVEDADSTQYLMWPFKAAERLAAETDPSSQLDPHQVQSIVMEEFQKLIPNDAA
jgi:tetratricopeptide (TPR) repeat protein